MRTPNTELRNSEEAVYQNIFVMRRLCKPAASKNKDNCSAIASSLQPDGPHKYAFLSLASIARFAPKHALLRQVLSTSTFFSSSTTLKKYFFFYSFSSALFSEQR